MGVMVEQPTDYFSQWIWERSSLLLDLEKEASRQQIPIIGPVVGRLLYLLVRLSRARRIVELGTATGYSAIIMGQALGRGDGRIDTFEMDPVLSERARSNVLQAGLKDVIKVHCTDARQGIEALDEPVDMIFMDIEKEDYARMLPVCESKLRQHGLLVADNTGFSDAHGFNLAIHGNPAWCSVNLWAFLPGHSPEFDGICLALKQ